MSPETDILSGRRQFFAEEIQAICNLQTGALVEAKKAGSRDWVDTCRRETSGLKPAAT